MEKELNIIKMEILYMMVNILMVKEKVKENLFVKMVIIMQGNLKIMNLMEKENYLIKKIILYMMVNILMVKEKEKENLLMKTVIIIQVNLKKI